MTRRHPTPEERDERVNIEMDDPEEALRLLLEGGGEDEDADGLADS